MDKESSVGLVETEIVEIPLGKEGFVLEKGGSLFELQVAFERYGKISSKRDNVILICHALTGDAHVAGYHSEEDKKPGWWDILVGPGKAVDTNKFHVICSNFLGGCKGTTGPHSINPATGKPYGITFPEITIKDMVKVQKLLLDYLEIPGLYAIIGGSAGGFQVLEWCVSYPEFTENIICIAAGESLSAQALAFDIVARNIIKADPHWNQGNYYHSDGPGTGLSIARMIGHITYLSRDSMTEKFGRKRQNNKNIKQFHTDFQVESYLNYQGQKFIERFDANSYLYITQAMNSFSLKEKHGSPAAGFARTKARFLIISISTDWLFPAEQSRELAVHLHQAGKEVTYCNFDSPYGHDSFLIKDENFSDLISSFINPQDKNVEPDNGNDFSIIGGFIEPGSKVLDLGCGDGEFLHGIIENKKVSTMGIDIDLRNIIECNHRGVHVFQADLDEGLKMIPDNTYDYAVLSYTLFEVRKPAWVLNEVLRVAKKGIVAFPNFSNWKCRFRLGIQGLLPESSDLPYKWYNTPNIHYLTLKDFRSYCRENSIDILKMIHLPEGGLSRFFNRLGFKGLGSDRIITEIALKNKK